MSSRYGLAIRAADGGDVEGVHELLRSAGVTVARAALGARLGAVLAQPGAVLLAEEWGPPTGLIALHWTATLAADLKPGCVTALVVDPDRRRSGVGRLLLKAAAQAARAAGCGELVVSVAPRMEELRQFCLASGFAEAGQVFTRSLRKRG